MFISRVEIDINNRKKIKDLSHVGAYHHWVESCFPQEIEHKDRTRKLWRIDRLRNKDYLIIISQEKPNLELLEKYGVEKSAESKNYDTFLDSLQTNVKMNFRVILNPVISLSQGTGNKGLVKPHITIEHQMKYLIDRAEKNGFTLDENECFIVERGYVTLRKTKQKPIRLIKVEYEGILTIEDEEKFKKVLTQGLGKHRAYGFGMMTVIPRED